MVIKSPPLPATVTNRKLSFAMIKQLGKRLY